MPRKPKFTREEVIASAFDVARKQGLEAVTAASVAANMGYTGSSLFTHFESMDEIKQEVYVKARMTAMEFFEGSINYNPAFKELGMRWIRFAKTEPNLYRMLFAGNPFTPNEDIMVEFKETFEPIKKEVAKTFDISEHDAEQLMESCINCSNGIALLMINGYDEGYTDDKLSMQLTNLCLGMVMLFKAKDGSLTIKMAEKMAAAASNATMPTLKE